MAACRDGDETMQQIPLEATPNQIFSVVLGGQNCTIGLYARTASSPDGGATRLYCDLAVSGVQIWSGVLCRNLVNLKLYPALPFAGALWFVDMQDASDPEWSGLGARYALLYAPEGVPLPAGVQGGQYRGAASYNEVLTA